MAVRAWWRNRVFIFWLAVLYVFSLHSYTRQAVVILIASMPRHDEHSKGDDSYESSIGCFATPGFPAAIETHETAALSSGL
jgi:hypothetical protein